MYFDASLLILNERFIQINKYKILKESHSQNRKKIFIMQYIIFQTLRGLTQFKLSEGTL